MGADHRNRVARLPSLANRKGDYGGSISSEVVFPARDTG